MSNIFLDEVNSYLYTKYDVSSKLNYFTSDELLKALEALTINLPTTEYNNNSNILNIGFYNTLSPKKVYNIDDNYFLGFVNNEYKSQLDILQNIPINNLYYYNLYLLFTDKFNYSHFSNIGKQSPIIELADPLLFHQSFHYLIFESVFSNKSFLNLAPINTIIKPLFLTSNLSSKLSQNCKTFFDLCKSTNAKNIGLDDKIAKFIYSRLVSKSTFDDLSNQNFKRIKNTITTFLDNVDINIDYTFQFSNFHVRVLDNIKKYIIFKTIQHPCIKYTDKTMKQKEYLNNLEKIINNYLSTFFLHASAPELQQISYVLSYFQSSEQFFINAHYYLFNYLITKLSTNFDNFLLFDFINIINSEFIQLNNMLDNMALTDNRQSISDTLYLQYKSFLDDIENNKTFFQANKGFIEIYIETLNIDTKISQINSVISDFHIKRNDNDEQGVPEDVLKDIITLSFYEFIIIEIDLLVLELEPYITNLFQNLMELERNILNFFEEFKTYLKILFLYYFTRTSKNTLLNTSERILIEDNVFSVKNEMYNFYLNYFRDHEGLDSYFSLDDISDSVLLNIQEDIQNFYFTAVGKRILNSMIDQYSFS